MADNIMICGKVLTVYALLSAAALCGTTAAAGERLHRLVSAAADGDTVRVPSGVYRIARPIVVPENKTLSILAEEPGGATVDAGGLTNCIVFLSKGANLLKGFTVRNGRGAPCIPGDGTWYAGGVVMRGGMIERCRVENCFTESPFKAVGGGITSWGAVKDSVVFEGCDSPIYFSNVDGLVVREIAFRACTGDGMRLANVRNFRADGFLTIDCGGSMMPAALELSGDCRDGMIRNVDAQGVVPVAGDTSSVILEAVSGLKLK